MPLAGVRLFGLMSSSPSFVPLQVVDELLRVQVMLIYIAGKRERIKILFKKSEWPQGEGTRVWCGEA